MSQSASSARLLRELASIADRLGFEYCSYVLRIPAPIASPSVTWSSTYPSQWLDHYFAHSYLDSDPVIQQTARELAPVVWASAEAKGQPEFWEEARAHGIQHGWALATHGKHMTTGMLSLARSHDKVSAMELSEKEPQLVWLSHVTHGLLGAIETKEERADIDDRLSLRELEVLRWSAEGKTADEIGRILGIATRTVTFHITSTLAKLNATNKTHAVTKAFLFGLL
ncbi:LuxR family transcriptional regulator [Rhodanobacter sp. BL-MT-08]